MGEKKKLREVSWRNQNVPHFVSVDGKRREEEKKQQKLPLQLQSGPASILEINKCFTQLFYHCNIHSVTSGDF